MELPSRLRFLRVRHPRRRRTYCCLMLLHSPLVSRCKVMYSEWSYHGTHLSRPTNPVSSQRLRTIRRLLHSLCMFCVDCSFGLLVLQLVTVTKESELSVVIIVCLASSSLMASLPCSAAKLSSLLPSRLMRMAFLKSRRKTVPRAARRPLVCMRSYHCAHLPADHRQASLTPSVASRLRKLNR